MIKLKKLLSESVNTDTTDLPRPNIARLMDDGTNSQLIIELEVDVDNAEISHTYTEKDNITNLSIINRSRRKRQLSVDTHSCWIFQNNAQSKSRLVF